LLDKFNLFSAMTPMCDVDRVVIGRWPFGRKPHHRLEVGQKGQHFAGMPIRKVLDRACQVFKINRHSPLFKLSPKCPTMMRACNEGAPADQRRIQQC
jgi:hypothetical protein